MNGLVSFGSASDKREVNQNPTQTGPRETRDVLMKLKSVLPTHGPAAECCTTSQPFAKHSNHAGISACSPCTGRLAGSEVGTSHQGCNAFAPTDWPLRRAAAAASTHPHVSAAGRNLCVSMPGHSPALRSATWTSEMAHRLAPPSAWHGERCSKAGAVVGARSLSDLCLPTSTLPVTSTLCSAKLTRDRATSGIIH
jgi:hypothetical protein